MNKRLAKRYKRQVSRAKEWIRLSEPGLGTPEQIKASRDSSRPIGTRGSDGIIRNPTPSIRNGRAHGFGSSAKTDV